MVDVIDIRGNPLPSIMRNGKVRKLLKSKRAKVISENPFKIQLTYQPNDLYIGETDMLNLTDIGCKNKGMICTCKYVNDSFCSDVFIRWIQHSKSKYMFIYNTGEIYVHMPSISQLECLITLQRLADTKESQCRTFIFHGVHYKDYSSSIPYIIDAEYIEELEEFLQNRLKCNHRDWFGYTGRCNFTNEDGSHFCPAYLAEEDIILDCDVEVINEVKYPRYRIIIEDICYPAISNIHSKKYAKSLFKPIMDKYHEIVCLDSKFKELYRDYRNHYNKDDSLETKMKDIRLHIFLDYIKEQLQSLYDSTLDVVD